MKKKFWLIPLTIFLTLSVVGSKDGPDNSSPQSSAWWSPDWHYRQKVCVSSGRYDRNDEPIELRIDFETVFSRSGISGPLDPNSIRVIDQSGSPSEVLSQFEPASGEIIWLTGSMEADTSKTYYVYFDILENGPKPPPRYYSTMKNGGLLALPLSGTISVIYKIEGVEYETARIHEADGEIGYLKPPLGSPLIDGGGSFLGFKKKEGTVEGGVVSITGGPLRYEISFHFKPKDPQSAVTYSDYCYTFYYVSSGLEVRTKFGHRWAASQSFVPQYRGAEWPAAFGIQEGERGWMKTVFRATASDTATPYAVQTTWGPLDGDATAAPTLSDNFWGAYGKDGGLGIIPIQPVYGSLCVDGYRSDEGWSWSAVHRSQVDLVERGAYSSDFWIYGYDQRGWSPARDFGNRTEEPVTIEADSGLFPMAAGDSDQKARIKISADRAVPAYPGLEGKVRQGDPKKQDFRVAWLGSDWTYRKRLSFNNSSQAENLIDFPVLVMLTPANFDYSHCQSDGRDIRFVDADDTTELKYQIESWNYNGDSSIWVKIPQIDGSSSTDYIWMYYGNAGAADAQDAENVWDSNFLAVWHLSEGGTGTRFDSTSRNNDGTPQNYDGDEAMAGAIDGADRLDGVNDYVQIPGSNIGTTSVTVESWARFTAFDATTFSPISGANPGGTVFSTRELDGHQSPTLCVSPVSGGAGVQRGPIFTFDSANDARGAKGRTALQLGRWYYMVGVFAYTGVGTFYGNWNVYLDGNRDNASANNFSYAGSISMPFNGTPWRIGDQNQWTNGQSNAAFDEVRISNVARSANWIAAQYLSMVNSFITFGTEAFATNITIEDNADGSGAEIDTRTVASSGSFVGYAISRDASGNFVANVAVIWSLIDLTGGVVDGDLVPAGDSRSATFTGNVVGTGRIRIQHATLGEDTTGAITVTAGVGASITIEDSADGSGAEIDTRTVASGDNFVGYAISRDASHNFVDNEAVTWGLIDLTGGVVAGDLVPSGDSRSATFTGHVLGTGRIRTQHASLGEDTTGVITVTAGVGASIAIEDSADGSGAEIDTRTIASGDNFVGYAISRDASNNFIDSVAVTWSLIDLTGGVVAGDLVPAGDLRSATFTGHVVGTGRIRALQATLGEDTTGVITVTAGAGVTIRIEDSADGSGAEIGARSVAAGASFVGYAISRDASGNFVDNAAVTWILTDRTGGVVDSDLIPSGDSRSAAFTGHTAGTGRIVARHATLGRDATGLITVTSSGQPPVAVFEFQPPSGSVPCEVSFDASLSYDSDGQIVSYDWDFGDGNGAQGVNTCHTYTLGGVFTVTLRVTDNDGLSDTASDQINLQATVYPPINVFLTREINRSLFRKEAFHTITWSLNPNNSSVTITGYRIYRKEAGEGDERYQLLGAVSGDAFAYVDGYLDINKAYKYVVTSVESSGLESGFSSPVGN